jgi:hypothetical protein
MSTDTTMYNAKAATASRTHESTIDITLTKGGSEIRIFLKDDLARKLVGDISVALATPAKDAA